MKKEDLAVTVTEKGTLESVDNKDIVCKVRAGAKGYATSINWVIDDGTLVKKDQLVMLLDDSDLQDKRRDQKIKVDVAETAKETADNQLKITTQECERLVNDQESVLRIAVNALNKFIGLGFDPARTAAAGVVGVAGALTEGGDYKRQVDDATGKVRLAESDVEQSRERSAWADRMVKMKYMSPAQAQAERSKLESNMENLRSLQAVRTLLLDHDRQNLLDTLRSAVDNAQKLLDQRKLEALTKVAQADSDRRSKTSVLNQEQEKLKDFEDQIKECRIHAPQEGMVVYFKQESNRFSSNASALIEQGAQVKEGQKMIRIPDLKRMQVNTKVHEAMVARIRGDVRRPTGFFEAVRAAFAVNPDPLTALVSQSDPYQEALGERYRHMAFTLDRPGQGATVRVDAMPDRVLSAHVRTVAAIASQADMMASDVKVYSTLVRIDDDIEGLKPDMTAEVTIKVDAAREQVLAVPLQAVVGGAEMGAARKLWVRTADGGYEERDVKLGLANEKMVEVAEGLTEGDEVVLNPKVLAGDKSKTRDAAAEAAKGGSPDGEKGGDPSKAGKKGRGKRPPGAGGPPAGGGPLPG